MVIVGLQCLTIFVLFCIAKGTFKNMATLQDLQDDLNDISTAVVEIADLIRELKEAGVSVITQAQLDALDEKAEQIKSALASAKDA